MGSPVLLGIPVLAFLFCSLSAASSSSSPPTTTTPLHNTSDDTDLQALLCLKQHLSGTAGNMASWRSSDSAQYCSWPGVTCDKRHTSRVFSIDLDSDNLHGQIPPCIGNLTFLGSIHLPNNKLDGQIPPELGHLRRLAYLNLSSNALTGAIPDSLSSCSRLQIIDLSNNFIEGDIPTSLEGCSDLQEIYLFNNKLSGVIPDTLGSLSNLSVLYLAQNNLTGGIPSSLGSNSFLSSLILTNNTLTGGIPPALANCPSLQWLDLTNTQLSGEIPSALFNSSSIVVLALGVNNFVGSIPQHVHTSSPLEVLILSQNNLSGSIPSSLGNLSSLNWLLLSQNNFEGSIPSSLSKIPKLENLDLSYNNLSGTVPAFPFNITTLAYLNIAMNDLWGEIPYDIGHTLPNLQTLVLQGNRFKGQIPVSLANNATNIQVLNLRDNLFHGIVPSFGNLPNLTELNLGMNQLEAGDWSFLSTLTNCNQLVQLNLDSNNLMGTLPNSIGDLPSSLQVLLLTANQISGTIPPEIEHLKNLTLLYMDQNLLEGSIPDSVGNLQNLFVLSLSRNKLSGQVPLSIGNLSKLSELNLQENNFSGPIPKALGYCKNLESLNLSCNSFSGRIPNELFTLFSLSEGLDLSHNKLSEEIPLDIGGLINLDVLNISNNQLSGVIPPSLGNCLHLVSLNLEGNLLRGTIPELFFNLRGVSEMDLSRNNLSGQIPEFFESLTSLKLLNLSFNNLEGPVPTSGIFQNIGEVFLQGNKLLCANIPWLQLPRCSTETSKRRRALSVILKIVGFSALPLFVLSCLAVILLKKRKKAKQASHPSRKELKKFSYADLVKATNGFSLTNLLGSGKSGSVYKGRFQFEEHTVAVKVFNLDKLGTPKSFLTECETLRNTRHRNLVRVITACSTFDALGQEFKALILEYMPNGSLESWLYPKPNMYGLKIPLSLGSRITIAMDIASALDYLHNRCMPPVVHCDLKPSNVLLDDLMGARLADFGLAKFLHSFNHSCHHSSTSLLGPRGTIGYIAPEYGFGRKLSTEGDIYSYGVIILEMLTGKRPTDEMFTNGLNLHKFVEQAFPQKIREVLDPCIILSPDGADVFNNLDHANNATAGVAACILHLAKLGLACSMEAPNDRPTTKDIYADVIKIKEAFAAIYMIE